MRIQTFNNGKGLIHGSDSKRIGCDIAGTLQIGSVEISITPESESIMPVLFNGCTGVYSATFTSVAGCVYNLERVSVNGGRIVPPTKEAVEMMELRCRVDTLEANAESLKEQINELRNIFDTNSLNFLIS